MRCTIQELNAKIEQVSPPLLFTFFFGSPFECHLFVVQMEMDQTTVLEVLSAERERTEKLEAMLVQTKTL